MKRLITSAALFLCTLLTFAQFSGSGSGTESDPYLILNPIQLNQLRNFLNKSGVYFKLMADIDLTEYLEDENPTQGWQPVGTSSSAAFKGILDGNGNTISGLWINRSNTDYVGLFGYTEKATIKNLTIVDVSIKGKQNVGALFGYGYNGSIQNCVFSGMVEGVSYIGGCVGKTSDDIKITEISSTVDVTGDDYIGGIIGGGYFKCLTNCCVYSKVTGKSYVGGIGGSLDNYNSEIVNCTFNGEVTGNSYVGGLCGKANSKSVKGCLAMGTITNNGSYTGGLIGYFIPSTSSYGIVDCYFSGSVKGQSNTGGLIGWLGYAIIKNCYSACSVVGTSYVGGLYGYCNSSSGYIKSNVVIATSIKATEGNVGRIYGYSINKTIGAMGSAEENKSYNRTIVISQGVAQEITDDLQNGTSVSATTLKLKATYVAMGWDFNDTWGIQETECYPYMQRQTAPPVILSDVVSGATTVSGKCIDGGLITLEFDGKKQQMYSTNHEFSFNVSPLQAGHEVRVSAKADDKEQSYFTTETVNYLGKGTETDPYQIYTAADLTGVYRKGYFKLMNNIDLTNYINQFSPTEGWESIGREGSETIHFDGNGHKISGLWCNSTRDNTGLFSCFANGEIKNLTIETADDKQMKGGRNTGILIGKMMNGAIENCHIKGTVADGTPVGGIVGLMDGGRIYRCESSVTITTENANSYIGGLVGEMTSGEIDQCYTMGTLTGNGSNSFVGGLVGNNSAAVTNSYSDAVISSSYNAAGLIAYNYGLVDKCYATGNLFSNNYAAGVIGYNDGENAIVQNCVAMNNKIEIVYESQQVQQGGGYGQRIIGGIKNNAPAPEMNNYALVSMQVSVNDVAQKVYDDIMNGTAKTNSELKAPSTYKELGWNFSEIWGINEGLEYPHLQWKDNNGAIPDDNDDPLEYTDISEYDNIIYVEDAETTNHSRQTLSVKMNNTFGVRGFQFDIILPSGVTIAEEDGFYLVNLSTERTTTKKMNYFDCAPQPDGSLRVLCNSSGAYTFDGTEGEVCTITVDVDELESGDYPIILKNIVLTDANAQRYAIEESIVTRLTVSEFTLGDVNADGFVDVADLALVANHILQRPTDVFVFSAADLNNDGLIDVSDMAGVANLVLHRPTNARAKAPRQDFGIITLSTLSAHINAGETTRIPLLLDNPTDDVASLQCDLLLPHGVSVENVELANERRSNQQADFEMLADGSVRILIASNTNRPFKSTEGIVAWVTLKASSNAMPCVTTLEIDNTVLTNNGNRMTTADKVVPLTIGGATGIAGITTESQSIDIYSITGQHQSSLQNGVNIIKSLDGKIKKTTNKTIR